MRKEHIYSSKKLVVHLDGIGLNEQNKAKIAMAFYKDQENVWFNYINDVFYNNKEITTNTIDNNVFEIARNITNKDAYNHFIDKTVKDKNFNPYIDSIDLEKYALQYRKLYKNIQTYLLENYNKDILIEQDNTKIKLVYSSAINELNYKTLLEQFNVLILVKYSNITIYSNKQTLNNIYKYLHSKEDFWQINKKSIHSCNKKTGIEFNEKLLKQLLNMYKRED